MSLSLRVIHDQSKSNSEQENTYLSEEAGPDPVAR